MLDTSGDPKLWSDITYIGCSIIAGAAAFLASRKGAADKRSQPVNPVQPVGSSTTGVTFMVDADLIRDMLAESKAQHADMVLWREEDERRRAAQERSGLLAKVKALEQQNADLKRGQGKTHGNQDLIVERLNDLMQRLDAMEGRGVSDASEP